MNAPRTPAITASLVLALGLATGSPSLRAQDPPPPDFAALLRNALFEEEASRDLEKAAAGYEAVLAAHEKQRQMAATALYRLAEVRRKQGRNKDAAAIYQRLISEFPGADPLPRLSRENLAAMGESAPDASPDGAPSGIGKEEEAELVRLASLAKNSPDLLNTEDGQPLETPLVRACRQGWIRAATFLLDAGVPAAATTRRTEPSPAGGRPGDENPPKEFNPLSTAASNGHLTLCELLISRGAPPSDSSNVLAGILEDKLTSVFDFLLSKGADLNPPGALHHRITPLSVAAANNDAALLDKLLKAGARPDFTFLPNKKTALMVAAASNSADCVKRLLDAGAAVTPVLVLSPGAAAQNPPQGSSALHLAVTAGALESAVLLLKAGADPNAPDGKEVLPLQMAGNSPRPAELIHALFEAGAKPEIRALASLLDNGALSEEAVLPLLNEYLARGANPLERLGESPAYEYTLYRKTAAMLLRRYVYPELTSGGKKISLSFPDAGVVYTLAEKSGDTKSPPSLARLLLDWKAGDIPSRPQNALPGESLDWVHLTVVGKPLPDGGASKGVAVDLSKKEPLPALEWGDVIEVPAAENSSVTKIRLGSAGGEMLEPSAESEAYLRASFLIPVAVKVPEFDGTLTLKGSLVTFDPTSHEAPVTSPSTLLTLLGAGTDTTNQAITLTRSPKEGGGVLRGDLMLKNLQTARLYPGDRLEATPSKGAGPRETFAVTLVCPGYPVKWILPLRVEGQVPGYRYTSPSLLQFLASFYAPVDTERMFAETPLPTDSDPETIATALSRRNYVHDRPVAPWPDWSGVRIRRSADGGEEILDPDLDGAMAEITAASTWEDASKRDIPLRAGDIVELPLLRDREKTPWPGFEEAAARLFVKALSMKLTIVDGPTFQGMEFTYVPPRFAPTSAGLLPLADGRLKDGRFSDPLLYEAARSLGRVPVPPREVGIPDTQGAFEYMTQGGELVLAPDQVQPAPPPRRRVTLPGAPKLSPRARAR